MKGEIDKELFKTLVHDHHLPLRAFIHSIGVKAEWVDDMAQETFVVAFQKMATFDSDRDFAKWIRGIAYKLVVNERRKNARRKRILNDHLTDLLAMKVKNEKSLEEGFDLNLKINTMQNCLKKLPEKSQTILEYRYKDNSNATEVAKKCSMSPAAVRQSLVRIRQLLKTCIEASLSKEAAT